MRDQEDDDEEEWFSIILPNWEKVNIKWEDGTSITDVFVNRKGIKKYIDSVPEWHLMVETDEWEVIDAWYVLGKDGKDGKPWKDWKDYILTNRDKEEIAREIKVPIVEKIIEKVEVIKEQPIITNEIKEVAMYEDWEQIVKKINDLELEEDKKIDAKHIKNLPENKTIIRNVASWIGIKNNWVSKTTEVQSIDFTWWATVVDNNGNVTVNVALWWDRYKTSSTTSQAIVSTGTLTFTVEAWLSYTSQQDIMIVHDAANHMHGQVVSYSGTSLVVDITHKTGSGTYASWVINLDWLPVSWWTYTASNWLNMVGTDIQAWWTLTQSTYVFSGWWHEEYAYDLVDNTLGATVWVSRYVKPVYDYIQKRYVDDYNKWYKWGFDMTAQSASTGYAGLIAEDSEWSNFFRLTGYYMQSSQYPEERIDEEPSVNYLCTNRDGKILSKLFPVVDISWYVPYTWATTTLNIGSNQLIAGWITSNGWLVVSSWNITASSSTVFWAAYSATTTNSSSMGLTNSLTWTNWSSTFAITQTWNTTGTPNLINIALTDTASNAASNLLRYQVWGTNRLTISKLWAINNDASSTWVNGITTWYDWGFNLSWSVGFIKRDTILGLGIQYNVAVSYTNWHINRASANYTTTTWNVFLSQNIATFAPTSGTATFTMMNIAPTVNQTWWASGITRGLRVNPTLTAAADFRAIDIVLGNVSLWNASFGGGSNVLSIGNATTVPTTNPTGWGILYVEWWALKYRGSSGTVTTIAAA